MTRLSDYDFELPEGLIASRPPERRDGARMLVLHRGSGRIEHRQFRDLGEYLDADDLLVFNNSKVVPARVMSDDGRRELLVLEDEGEGLWRCLVRPGKKLREGGEIVVGGELGVVEEVHEDGARGVRFRGAFDLLGHGRLALPPYMGREEEPEDRERYQTVYAREAGSVAAPTAGLHFTGEMLGALRHSFVTLHVGPGTFRPVQVDKVEEHLMHRERFEVSELAANEIGGARRVLAVGTTVVRVLEHLMVEKGAIEAGRGSTAIFLRPPYQFRRVDRLLTNFHLPRSTLLMLVSAFAGRELVMGAYREAVEEGYRFFSYGDCMLVL